MLHTVQHALIAYSVLQPPVQCTAATSTVFYVCMPLPLCVPHHLHNANVNRALAGCTHSTDMSMRLWVVGKHYQNSRTTILYRYVALCILHFAGARCVDYHALYDQPFRSQRWAGCHHTASSCVLQRSTATISCIPYTGWEARIHRFVYHAYYSWCSVHQDKQCDQYLRASNPPPPHTHTDKHPPVIHSYSSWNSASPGDSSLDYTTSLPARTASYYKATGQKHRTIMSAECRSSSTMIRELSCKDKANTFQQRWPRGESAATQRWRITLLQPPSVSHANYYNWHLPYR